MVHIVECLERLLQLLERTGDHKLFKGFKVSVLSHSHALEPVVVEHRDVLQRWTCWKFEVMGMEGSQPASTCGQLGEAVCPSEAGGEVLGDPRALGCCFQSCQVICVSRLEFLTALLQKRCTALSVLPFSLRRQEAVSSRVVSLEAFTSTKTVVLCRAQCLAHEQ
ncbi:uncharacterized protein ACIQIH_018464 isoform 1-T6 [Cyanocitta cristata]